MQSELDGWVERGVCTLVSKKEAHKAIQQGRGQLLPMKWVVTEKCDPDPRVKARLVVRGDKDRRTDVLTDAPTAPQHILRCALLASVCHGRDLLTADVGQAFLNAKMTEEADIYVPVTEANPAHAKRFAIPDDADPDYYWKMDKAGYGLPEAGLLWYLHLVNKVLTPQGWRRSHAHPCLFLKKNASLVIYVDDILGAGERAKLERLLKDMGLNFRHITLVDHQGTTFAGVEIKHFDSEIVLGMRKYAATLEAEAKTTRKPQTPLPLDLGPPGQGRPLNKQETTEYRALLGKILWLALWRMDLAQASSYHSRSMTAPTDHDFRLLRRTAKYAAITKNYAIRLPKLNPKRLQLLVYADSTWAAGRDNFKSQAGHIILASEPGRSVYDAAPLLWVSRLQRKVARSSFAAELLAMETAMVDLDYIRSVMKDLLQCDPEVIVYTDNMGLYDNIYRRANSLPKDKSVLVASSSLKSLILENAARVEWIESGENVADDLTKPTTQWHLTRMLKD